MNKLYLTAPVNFLAQDSVDPGSSDALVGNDAKLPMKFSGVAYSGGPVGDYWYGNNTVVDLKSVTIEQSLPLLCEHERDDYIGVVTQTSNNGFNLNISGELFSDIDDQAADIARKSLRGAKYQMSIGLFDSDVENFMEGDTEVNGTKYSGSLTVLKNGIIREVSIVTLGADRNTSANFFSLENNGGNMTVATKPEKPETDVAEIVNTVLSATAALSVSAEADKKKAESDKKLSETEKSLAEASARIIELTGEVSVLNAKLSEVIAEAKLSKDEYRKKEISALFSDLGRECPATSVPLYLALNDEAFAAIASDMRISKPVVPAHLFQEQAVGDVESASQNAVQLSVSNIYKARSSKK